MITTCADILFWLKSIALCPNIISLSDHKCVTNLYDTLKVNQFCYSQNKTKYVCVTV